MQMDLHSGTKEFSKFIHSNEYKTTILIYDGKIILTIIFYFKEKEMEN